MKKEDLKNAYEELREENYDLRKKIERQNIELNKLQELIEVIIQLQLENKRMMDTIAEYKYSQNALIHENEVYKTTFEVLKEKY